MTTQAAPHRARIVDAAVELTKSAGWSAVTMARLAEDVGLSRRTVYNEVGSKPALAEAMVLAELERFLSLVDDAFARHPDDVVEAIRDAARGVLELAEDNALLRAIVSATHGADTELLPLLTTHAESVLRVAKTTVTERVAAYGLPLSDSRRDAAIDTVVRVVLSHVMQPSAAPADTADDLAWIAARVLRA